MVQFPQFRFHYLFIQQWITYSRMLGYPIRLSTDHRIFAPPRRFSQLVTAFFALIRQGIHHKPYFHLTILLFPGIILRIIPLSLLRKLMDLLSYSFMEFFASKIFDFAKNILNKKRSFLLPFPEPRFSSRSFLSNINLLTVTC